MPFILLTQNLILYILIYINAAVAQLVERRTENPYVVGSIPTCGTIKLLTSSEAFFYSFCNILLQLIDLKIARIV